MNASDNDFYLDLHDSSLDEYNIASSNHNENFLSMLNELSIQSSFISTMMKSANNASPRQKKSKKNSPKLNLEEIFKCFICFGIVKNAQMCPFCSKLCCSGCIKKWLNEQRPQCPHCRASLRVSQLVNCRFVSEITSAMEVIGKEVPNELCKSHGSKMQYYCLTCQFAICADCAMLGKEHKGHEFEQITKNETTALKKRLKALNLQFTQLENHIEKVNKAKEEKSAEAQVLVEQLNQKLESELKSKLLVLLSQKSSVAEEIEFLENLQKDISQQLSEAPKTQLIEKSEELVKMIKDINEKPINKFQLDNVSLEFNSELVPGFDSSVFRMKPYSYLRDNCEIVYSDPLHSNGLTWRLKIYPNGNGVAKGSYISVFLEMLKGLQESSKYEYRIEMQNQRNGGCVVREFASEFENGECWGYNRFFKIEFLEREVILFYLIIKGYLIPEDDTIVLKYYVRAPSYYQLAMDQKRYIGYLENAKENAMKQLKEIKKEKDSKGKKRKKSLEKENENEPLTQILLNKKEENKKKSFEIQEKNDDKKLILDKEKKIMKEKNDLKIKPESDKKIQKNEVFDEELNDDVFKKCLENAFNELQFFSESNNNSSKDNSPEKNLNSIEINLKENIEEHKENNENNKENEENKGENDEENNEENEENNEEENNEENDENNEENDENNEENDENDEEINKNIDENNEKNEYNEENEDTEEDNNEETDENNDNDSDFKEVDLEIKFEENFIYNENRYKEKNDIIYNEKKENLEKNELILKKEDEEHMQQHSNLTISAIDIEKFVNPNIIAQTQKNNNREEYDKKDLKTTINSLALSDKLLKKLENIKNVNKKVQNKRNSVHDNTMLLMQNNFFQEDGNNNLVASEGEIEKEKN